MNLPPVTTTPQFACSNQPVQFGAKWPKRNKAKKETKVGERVELMHVKENMQSKKGRLRLAEETAQAGTVSMALGSLVFPPLAIGALGSYIGGTVVGRKANKIAKQELAQKVHQHWVLLSVDERKRLLKEFDRSDFPMSQAMVDYIANNPGKPLITEESDGLPIEPFTPELKEYLEAVVNGETPKRKFPADDVDDWGFGDA